MAMQTVLSRDGTSIACYVSGAGPPLVLVHGMASLSAQWPVLPALERHFTVWVMCRRGRGDSGDGADYDLNREAEDIAAALDATGESANLLGHSYGALCALEATLLTRNLRTVILYEPYVPPLTGRDDADDLVERLEAMLAAGDEEGALATFLAEEALMTPAEISAMRAAPSWPDRLATARTLSREIRAEALYRLEADRFRGMNVPTLLLLGGDSSSMFIDSAARIDAALPNSRIAVLPGQSHIAMYSAPDLFVQEVLDFLT